MTMTRTKTYKSLHEAIDVYFQAKVLTQGEELQPVKVQKTHFYPRNTLNSKNQIHSNL